ncbi:MAG: hypothetical protein K6360_04335 [Deltaproteobacteria bacterium]
MKKALRNVAITSAVIAAPVVVASQAGAAEKPTGIGTYNVGPAYIASDGISTFFELVNTSPCAQEVHVSLRSRGNSADLWDRKFTLTGMDVLILQIYDDHGTRMVKVVNGSDSSNPAAHEKTGYEEPLSGADNSCTGFHFDDTVGYIFAWDEDKSDSVWMGNTRITTGSGLTVAINNAAADNNPDRNGSVVDGYLKDKLYVDYIFNNTTLILTHPTPDGVSSGWRCGFFDVDKSYFTLYDYDEKYVGAPSPYRFPAEELSVILFTDKDPNAQIASPAFYTINGSKTNKGLGFNISASSFGAGIATMDLRGLLNLPDNPRNTVCSYMTVDHGDIFWLPCQYDDNITPTTQQSCPSGN